MQGNDTNDIIETLVKYLDGELTDAEKAATEQLLQTDAALQERYQYLLAAKQAIYSRGIRQRVNAIHTEYLKEAAQPVSKQPAKVIRLKSFVKTLMRVAAVLVLVVTGYGIYQYATTTRQSVYVDNFVSYQLPVTRGETNINNIEDLYRARNYNAVVETVNNKQQKTQEDYFIAAQAYLQLNDAKKAVNAFTKVKALNAQSPEKYFAQETDFYLALAYIKAGNIDAAKEILSAIKANPQHLFYNNAKQISDTKLQMLKWKN